MPGFVIVRANSRRPYMACGWRLHRDRELRRQGAGEISGHWWEDTPYYAHAWRSREAAEKYAAARVKGEWEVVTQESLGHRACGASSPKRWAAT